MQEIITEILERLGFPTKNVGLLAFTLGVYSKNELLSLSVITNNEEIMGYSIGDKAWGFPNTEQVDYPKPWRYCSLGSELVTRLKGGEW